MNTLPRSDAAASAGGRSVMPPPGFRRLIEAFCKEWPVSSPLGGFPRSGRTPSDGGLTLQSSFLNRPTKRA